MKRYTFVLFLCTLFLTNFFLPAEAGAQNFLTPGNDNPPEIKGIPDQKIESGKFFRPDTLPNYTVELDGDAVLYSVTGMINLEAEIDTFGILRVRPVNTGWTGSEQLIITVTDKTVLQLSGSDTVVYTIRQTDNPPFLSDIPWQSIGINGKFAQINLNEYFTEYDGDEVEWKMRVLPDGQPDQFPGWEVAPGNYNLTMNISAKVKSNGRMVNDETGYLAAFINGEVRGVSRPTIVNDEAIFNMVVYSNNSGDTIRFRYFDSIIVKNLPVLQTTEFFSILPSFPSGTLSLDAGNIVLKRDGSNFVTIERPDSSWAGTERAEFLVRDKGTISRLYDSTLVGFTVMEGIVNPIASPANLTAAASGSAIALSWDDSSNNETGFVIQRKEGGISSNEPFVMIDSAGANITTYNDEDVDELKYYTYRVFATNNETQSEFSNLASALSGNFMPPAAPANLSGEAFNKRVDLTWSPNAEKDLAGYIIYSGALTESLDSLGAVGHENTAFSAMNLVNGQNYNFYVQAYDTSGNRSELSNLFSLAPANHAPEFTGEFPQLEAEEDDPADTLYNVDENFQDADGDQLTFSAHSSDSSKVIPVYSDHKLVLNYQPDQSGEVQITVNASDGAEQASAQFVVTVSEVNDPPAFTNIPEIVFNEDDTAEVFLNKYVADPDNDTTSLNFWVYVLGQEGTISENRPTKGKTPGIEENDPFNLHVSIDEVTHVATLTMKPDSSGQYKVVFGVYDQGEANDADTVDVTVNPVNDAPVLVEGLGSFEFEEDEGEALLTSDVKYMFGDIDGDTLSYTATVAGEGVTSRLSNDSLYIQTLPDKNGVSKVILTASDGEYSVSDTITVTLLPVNDPPVLGPIPDLTFNEDDTLTVHLNQYVYDVDNDTSDIFFNVQNLNEPSGLGKQAASRKRDENGNIKLDFENGSLYINLSETDNVAKFWMDPNESGEFDVRFVAYDQNEAYDEDTAGVSVKPVNDAPFLIQGLSDQFINEDDGEVLISSSLREHFGDIEEDLLTFTASSGGGIFTTRVSGDSLFIKTMQDKNGADVVIITASDGFLSASDSFKVTINPVNDSPYIFAHISDKSYLEDQGKITVIQDLKEHFKDVDGDTLDFFLSFSGSSITTALSNDSLTIQTLLDQYGVDTIVVHAADNQFTVSDTFGVNILPINDAPVLADLPDVYFNEDDSSSIKLNNYVYDVDNDTTELTFTANVFSAEDWAPVKNLRRSRDSKGNQVIEVGTGDLRIVIDNTTHTAVIKASADSNGVFGVEFAAADDSNAVSKDSITVGVSKVNDPPYVAIPLKDASFTEDIGKIVVNSNLKVNFKDTDRDKLSFSVTSSAGPLDANISGDSLYITTIADKYGKDTLIVTAGDGEYTAHDTMIVTILPVNDAPLISGIYDLNFNEDDSVSVDLDQFVADIDNDTTQITFTANVLAASSVLPPDKVKRYSDKEGNSVIEVGTGDLIVKISALTHVATVKAKADSNGLFSVEFVAADDSGATSADTAVVRVNKVNDAPYIATPLPDLKISEDAGNVAVITNLNNYFKDVDGDKLYFSTVDQSGVVNAAASNDTLFVTTNNNIFGKDTIVVQAHDGLLSVRDTLVLTVLPVNDAPVLSALPDIFFSEDDSASLDLNDYVYDVDNDTTEISFTANVFSASHPQLLKQIQRYKNEEGNSVIEVGTGDLLITIDNLANRAYIKAKADSNGVFGVEFTAIDDSNASDKDSIDIYVNPVNDPPVVSNPLPDVSYSEDAGMVNVVPDLKQYFRDVDFDDLSFSVVSGDGGPLTASIRQDSLFIETHQDKFGADTLIVSAYDGSLSVSDTMIVKILPVNDAPELSEIPDLSFDEDDSTAIALNPYLFDVDNDTTDIVFTANVFSAANSELLNNVKRYKDGSGNSVIEVGTGDLIIRINNETNTAYISSSPDSNGYFGVEFTATDDSSAFDKDTSMIRVFKVNDPPYIFSAVADTAFLEDAGEAVLSFDLKQHFRDVDFDTLLFFAESLDPQIDAYVRGDSLFVNTNADQFGAARLELRAFDGEFAAIDTVVVNILPLNDAPVLENLPDIVFNEDDSTTVRLNDYLFDVDNDTTQIAFTANVYSASDTTPLKNLRRYTDKNGFSVIEVGTGDLIIRIDTVSNIAYMTASPDSNGYFSVEFTATDDSLAFDKDTMLVRVAGVNDPPYIYAIIPDTTFLEDAGEHLIASDLKHNFRDVDFDALSFSVSVLDTTVNAEIRGDSLFISTIEDFFGINAVAVSAYDGQYTTVDTFLVNILPVNDTPVFEGVPDLAYNEDDSIKIYLNDYLYDVDNDTTELDFVYSVSTPVVPTKKLSVKIVKGSDSEDVIYPVSMAKTQEQGALILRIDSLTHAASFSTGADSSGIFDVVFTVSDDSGATASDTIRVTINPVNDPPVKHFAFRDTTFLEDPGPIVLTNNIYSYFNDIDNDSLTFNLEFSGTGLQYSIIDSVFTIEPDSHYNGGNTVKLFATDGEYTVSDTFNVFVRSVNDAPRVNNIPPILMPEDTVYRFDLDQYVYDPDHDTTELVWMAQILPNADLEKAVKKLRKKNAAADGDEIQIYQSDNKTVLKTAADSLIITINTSTHVATVVATLNFTCLNIPVLFTARDPLSAPGSDTTTITVFERNDPPVITGSIPQFTMNEDDSLQVLYSSLYPYISDPETPDSLLGIIVKYSGNNFVLNFTPLSVQLKPKPNWFGTDTVYLSVTDYIDTVTAPIRIRVTGVNDMPFFTGLPDSIRFRGDSSVTLKLWDYVSDLETPDSLLLYSFNRNNDSLQIQYTAATGNLRLFSLWNYGGVVRLLITVRDQGNAVVRDSIFIYIDKFVDVADERMMPDRYSLAQNYPNPFNPSTVIKYGLPKDGSVEITVYNIAGQRVRSLVGSEMKAGMHEVTFDGRNDFGQQLPSGIYFYKMHSSSFTEVKKLIMLK